MILSLIRLLIMVHIQLNDLATLDAHDMFTSYVDPYNPIIHVECSKFVLLELILQAWVEHHWHDWMIQISANCHYATCDYSWVPWFATLFYGGRKNVVRQMFSFDRVIMKFLFLFASSTCYDTRISSFQPRESDAGHPVAQYLLF